MELGIATAAGCQRVGMSRLGWVEVRTDVAARVGRRVDIDRNTLAKTQLAVIGARALQTCKATQQQAVALEHWIDFPAIPVGVAFVREIAFTPSFTHGLHPSIHCRE